MGDRSAEGKVEIRPTIRKNTMTSQKEISKEKWKHSYAVNMKKLIRKVGRSADSTTFNPPKEIADHMRKSKLAVQLVEGTVNPRINGNTKTAARALDTSPGDISVND